MLVRIEIKEDNGDVIVAKEGPAMQPFNFRALAERPLEDNRFWLYGFSYTPITKLKPLEPTR